MKVLRRVATFSFRDIGDSVLWGKIHAVTADWTGATLCGIDIKEHRMTEYIDDKPISCKRCLKLMKQSEDIQAQMIN